VLLQPQEDLGPIPDDIDIYEYRHETTDGKNCAVQNEKMFEYLTQKEDS